MRISFKNGDGTGFSESLTVAAGTNVSALFRAQMGDVKPDNYVIRLTRNGVRVHPEAGDVLQEGDRVTVLPSKLQGAQQ